MPKKKALVKKTLVKQSRLSKVEKAQDKLIALAYALMRVGNGQIRARELALTISTTIEVLKEIREPLFSVKE